MRIDMLATGENVRSKGGTLPWAASLTVHFAALFALLLIPATTAPPLTTPEHNTVVIPLIYRPPTPIRPVPKEFARTPLLVPRSIPQPRPVRAVEVREMPAMISEHPRPATIVAPTPVTEAVAPEVPLAQPKLKVVDLPSRPEPVKTGVFGGPGQTPNGHTPAPRLEVQTGGFGGPAGNAPPSNAAASGSGVQTGGFGDATSSGLSSGNRRPALVADAGFGSGTLQAAPPRRAETSAPAETPVEVLWKPKPVYTDEARAKKLEGDVTLEVVFRASGSVQVVRVVHGLGHGLDESARTAAEQIRFRPGKKDGVPVDRTGLVLITFEMS
jgi:TonB family protein